VIALTTAVGSVALHKLTVFEPPLFARRPLPVAQLARFDKAIARGNLGVALTAAGKAVVPALKCIPGWLLTLLMNRALAREAKQLTSPASDDLTLRELALSLPYDLRAVTEMHGALPRWSTIQAEVLLQGGSKSLAYLKADLDALEKILPHVTRIEFKGLGHADAWNHDRRGL
jgi:hypothetical protein